MDLSLEWQTAKDNAWRNPYLVAACLSTAIPLIGGFCWSTIFLVSKPIMESMLLLIGMALGIKVSDLKNHSLATPPPMSLDALALRDDGSVIEQHGGWLWILGVMGLAPQACSTAAVLVLQLGGQLGKLRLDMLIPLAGLVVPLWAACSLCFFASMLIHWHGRACRKIERQYDVLCQVPGIFGNILCGLETVTECQLIVLTLYVYTLAAAVSLVGTLLCLLGLVQAQRWLTQKWTRLRSEPSTLTSWWDSDIEGTETEGLLGNGKA